MGLFADVVWADGRWVEDGSGGSSRLRIVIHDSDIATVTFAASSGSAGLFFLGFEPALYFEEPAASGPVDQEAEAAAFVDWAAAATGRTLSSKDIIAMMASPEGAEPEDVFVEETVERLLSLMGLTLPGWV